MQLQWFGLSCVKISAQQSDVSVFVDPFDPAAGVRLAKQAADIAIVSTNTSEYNYTEVIRANEEQPPFFISTPGEFEVKGVFVYGVSIAQEGQSTIAYAIHVDDVSVVVLGALNRTLTEKELDALGQADILIVPVGGNGVLNAKRAAEVVNQLEPRVVIPVHYQVAGFKKQLDPVGAFLKEYGVVATEGVDKVKLMKKDLPADETKVIIVDAR